MDTNAKIMLGVGLFFAGFMLYKGFAREEPPPADAHTWSDQPMETQVMAWKELIWRQGLLNRVDPALIAAIMAAESSGQNVPARLVKVSAEDKWDWVVGLMQVRLDTASWVCDVWHEFELKTPETNVHCGAKYLRNLLDRFSSMASAVSAYQMGPFGVYADSMMGGYANPQYISNVLEMARRFRVLFVTWRPAEYVLGFPKSEWDYAAALQAAVP